MGQQEEKVERENINENRIEQNFDQEEQLWDKHASKAQGKLVTTQESIAEPMRKWRVGTVSMGISLITLGILIFLQQAVGYKVWEPISVWWPLILVLLGIEMLCYLLFNKHARLRYDMLSIMFIALLGSAATILTVLTSLGIMDEFRSSMYQASYSNAIPEWRESVAADVEKVVIFTGRRGVMIDETHAGELQIIGTYRTQTDQSSDHAQLARDDIATAHVVDNVIYVHMIDTPRIDRLFNSYTTSIDATIIVPEHVEWEVIGDYTSLVSLDESS